MEVSRLIKYNTKVEPTPTGKDPAEYACFEKGEGYCDVFATAVVQMARAVGIPCRYTIGYLPSRENINSVGTQILLESDRHAWAEAFFDGVGWVPFDATIGAEVVPGGDRRHSENTSLTFVQIVGYILNSLIVIAIAIGAFAMYKAKTAPRTAEVVRAEMDRTYLVFVSSIWKFTGQRRLLSETTNEYLERVSEKLGDHRVAARSLAEEFTSRMFSRTAPSDEQVAKLQADVAHFVKQLRAAKK
jgi:transglutaminase-like putative cysteine protease